MQLSLWVGIPIVDSGRETESWKRLVLDLRFWGWGKHHHFLNYRLEGAGFASDFRTANSFERSRSFLLDQFSFCPAQFFPGLRNFLYHIWISFHTVSAHNIRVCKRVGRDGGAMGANARPTPPPPRNVPPGKSWRWTYEKKNAKDETFLLIC